MRWATVYLLLVFFGLGASSVAAASGWNYSEELDQVRGTLKKTAIAESENKYDYGPNGDVSVDLAIIQTASGVQGAMLVPHGDRFACEDNMCLVTVKFDDGKINEYLLMLRRWRDSIGHHFNKAEFLGSIDLASRVIMEVPLAKGGRREFAFNVSDLPIKAIPKPAKVLSVAFGSSLADFKNLGEKRIGMSGEECYKTENKDVLALDGVEGVGSVCFFQGRFFAAVLETSDLKADNSSTVIKAHLNKVFDIETEEDNPIKDYQSWPGIKHNDGTHTKSVGAFLNDGTTVFVIKDNAIFPLLPEEQ